MVRVAKELSALAVSRLTKPGMHAVGGAAGLHLAVGASGSRSWLVRVNVDGKRREMGLGPFPLVSLATARQRAREARADSRMGVDPVAQRIAERSARQALTAKQKTFADCAKAYIEAHESSWSNAKHRAQWPATFETYVYPTMGAVLVGDVTQAHVMAVLLPIWKTKTQTATRLRGRIEQVLSWATAAGFRQGENCARWTGLLDQLLPAPGKVAKVRHHPAVPVAAIPAFLAAVRLHHGVSPQALEFALLTAARSGEVRGATWAEIDLDAAIWTVPGERMKAGKEHRVPLSAQTIKLLEAVPRIEGTELVFPAPRGGVLSDMALTALTRRMAFKDAEGQLCVPHGLRSSFKDWCFEHTEFHRDLAEQALAHTLESKVEAAYRRGDALERRRAMMQAWADYCENTTTSRCLTTTTTTST